MSWLRYFILFILFILFFSFVTCGFNPRLKKVPLPVKVIRNVESIYNPAVDILFIIDDSGSMRDKQELLAKNAEMFISHFLNVGFIDYHIGVTTSSHKDRISVAGDGKLNRCRELEGQYRKEKYFNYVDKKTHRGEECLAEMMKVGTGGAGDEQFLSIPHMVFSGPVFKNYNTDFYRPSAHLAIFVITDAIDQSKVKPENAYKFLVDLKDGAEQKLHYAIGTVTFKMPSCSLDNKTQGPNKKLKKMVSFFGLRGYQFNLCQSDYGEDLAQFATHLVESVLTIPFSSLPDISSIEVYYEYAEGIQTIPNGPQGWSYDADNNTINLSKDIQLEGEEGKFQVKFQPLYTLE